MHSPARPSGVYVCQFDRRKLGLGCENEFLEAQIMIARNQSQRHLNFRSVSERCTAPYFVTVAALVLVTVFPIWSANVNLNSSTGTHGLIMVDKVGGYVRFFDPATDKELASIDPSDGVGIKPHELAISPDHKTAY